MRKLKIYRVVLTAQAEFFVPATSRQIARLEALRVTDNQPIFPGWKIRRCVIPHQRRRPIIDWLNPPRRV